MRTITFKLILGLFVILGLNFESIAQIPGSDTDIKTYSFDEQTGDATITPPTTGNGKVEIEVKYGTNLNGLVATFTLSDGATADVSGTAQESSVTPNDFEEGVAKVYTVTAEDGSTTKDWDVIVTIAAKSSEKDILAFDVPNQNGDETINATLHTVDLTVSSTTDLNGLVATFELSDEATAKVGDVAQVSGETPNDFEDGVAKVYTIIAQDESTQDWEVTITKEDNTETDITAYSFAEQTGDATITAPLAGQNGKVDIEVKYGTNLNGLVATFELSIGASADISGTAQESGVTANNFEEGVAKVYTVTAEDGTTTQDWDITVSIAAAKTGNDIIEYSLTDQVGDASINLVNHTVDVTVGQDADLSNLIATFELSEEATANIEGTEQESGVTANAFTEGVAKIYTVVAQNGDEQDWEITVTKSTEDNTETDITAYSFDEQTGEATITTPLAGQNGKVEIEVKNGTNLNGLVASFELSYGATATVSGTDQVSGTTPNDFVENVALVYTITAEDGTTTQDWDIIVSVATSTQVQNIVSEKTFGFYPNPATENIQIVLEGQAPNTEVQIFDMTGKPVKQMMIENNVIHTVNVSDLETGIYIIKVGNEMKKFIKR